jgi:uncharacterized membrane protein
MIKNRGLWVLAGFLLFVFGITALFLQLVGVSWYVLSFLEIPGRLFALTAKIAMVMIGVLVVVLAQTNWDREMRESSEE